MVASFCDSLEEIFRCTVLIGEENYDCHLQSPNHNIIIFFFEKTSKPEFVARVTVCFTSPARQIFRPTVASSPCHFNPDDLAAFHTAAVQYP
jgi:hypothetical protein